MRRVLDPHSDVLSAHHSLTKRDFPFHHHISARELKRVFDERGWDWPSYRKFCVVRNPFDRIVSLYHHRMSPPAKREGHCSILNRVRKRLAWWFFSPSSFAEFVEQLDPTSGLTKSIEEFAFRTSGEQLVDDFLRYERLSEEAPEYLRELGLATDDLILPRINASENRRAYADYYDDETRDRVEKLYRFDVERFGYSTSDKVISDERRAAHGH